MTDKDDSRGKVLQGKGKRLSVEQGIVLTKNDSRK